MAARWLRSLLIETNVKPSARARAPASPSLQCIPQPMPAASAAARISARARGNSGRAQPATGSSLPSAMDRSDGPTYRASTPGTALIAATLRSPSAVSIMTMQATSSSAARSPGPMVSPDRTGPRLRRPAGGYRHAATAAAACSAVLTSGTITPRAPASSTRPIPAGSSGSTRTIPAAPVPAAATAVSPYRMPG